MNSTTASAVADRDHSALLQSIVDVARAIYSAAASSIFLYDPARDELIFQAVSGAGQGILPGRGFPATRGIAGWVLTSREAIIVDDLTDNTTFARDIAESTEYVPSSLMAAPLLYEDQALGVLEVLDPHPQSRAAIAELELLTLFAAQASVALRVIQRDRHPDDADKREAGRRLVEKLAEIIG
jgi:GAF domain-containing protein